MEGDSSYYHFRTIRTRKFQFVKLIIKPVTVLALAGIAGTGIAGIFLADMSADADTNTDINILDCISFSFRKWYLTKDCHLRIFRNVVCCYHIMKLYAKYGPSMGQLPIVAIDPFTCPVNENICVLCF